MTEEKLLYMLIDLVPDIVISADQFSKFDFTTDRSIVEIKCRRTHYSTLLIEKNKYEALIKVAKERSKVPVYICSTPKGVWMFNLLDFEEPIWETKHLPKTTEFGGGMKQKQVGYLRVSEGKKIINL